MQIEATRKLFTVDEYYRMAEAGIIGPGDRVELIDGEVIQMTPLGHKHMVAVNRANDILCRLLNGKGIVSVQNALRLSNYTEPQPDIVIFKYRADFYQNKTMAPEDALVVIEVSDTTLRYDRETKLPRYAAAGIPEAWIVNLKDAQIEIYRNPVGGAYKDRLTLERGDAVSVAAFPELPISTDQILG